MKLVIANTDIHQDAYGRFSLNDLHAAAVEAGHDYKTCQVEHFMRNDKTQELADEIRKNGELKIDPVASKAGRYGGTYVAKELVYAYAMWISPKFHLQVIRTFDEVATGKAAPSRALQPPRLFPDYYKVARLIGCDKNAAAISANQAVLQKTGENVLALLGQTHIEAEKQEVLFNVSDLMDGISGQRMNKLLAAAGMQTREGEQWVPTPTAKEYSRIYDTGKRHGSGVPITAIKWSKKVLDLLTLGEAA